jgi:sulfite reductase (NADPH) flavoprotein alpha-component
MSTALIPASAPFSEEQRAWLNGFLAGLLNLDAVSASVPASTPFTAAGGMAASLLGQQLHPGAANNAVLGSSSAVAGLAGAAGRLVAAVEGTAVSDPPAAEADQPWHDPALELEQRLELASGRALPDRLMAAMAQLDCGSCGYLCQTYSAAIASGEEKNLALCSPGGSPTLKAIKSIMRSGAGATQTAEPRSTSAVKPAPVRGSAFRYTRSQPYTARLLESRPLNGPGSSKDTRHVAIDLADSGITYDVGDALGVYPTNDPHLVDALLHHLGWNPEERRMSASAAKPGGDSDSAQPLRSLRTVLLNEYCLRSASDEFLEWLLNSANAGHEALTNYLEEGVPSDWDLLDLLQLAGVRSCQTEAVLDRLSPLQPRLYSIASSQRQVGTQVHLTVGKVTLEKQGRLRRGACSTMFAERLTAGDPLRVFVHKNHGGFTVPRETGSPMIMIGPGTGIAPFMAFLQEREATHAVGQNWLFFGDQHAASDYLYRDQLERWQQGGLLTRLDLAFSRDQARKIYVQDRMREAGEELWRWLQRGAYVFVCGDASRMAQDVDRALRDIIASHGGLDDAAAADYVNQLRKSQRYVRDVY